jgi:hypothetical protein
MGCADCWAPAWRPCTLQHTTPQVSYTHTTMTDVGPYGHSRALQKNKHLLAEQRTSGIRWGDEWRTLSPSCTNVRMRECGKDKLTLSAKCHTPEHCTTRA